MRSDTLQCHMKQHEKEDYQNEMFCSTSITTSKPSLQEETESEFSLVSTNTYEVSPLEREEMTKRLIKELKFQTPNIVIVFSNDKPDIEKLSKDRWKIFKIIREDLLDVTENIKYK